MWDELAYGALGAVILADVRRLGDCFPSVNYFEKLRLPFVVAVNCFDDAPSYDPQEIRQALDLDPGTPLVLCDARDVASVKGVLITLVETIASRRPARAGVGRLPHRAAAVACVQIRSVGGQRQPGGVVAAHAVHARAGRSAGRAQVDPRQRSRPRTGRQARAAD